MIKLHNSLSYLLIPKFRSNAVFSFRSLIVAIVVAVGMISPDLSMAQTFTDSNLPIIIINTNGEGILDEPKINATMKIIYRGAGLRNYVADQNTPGYLNYNGDIGIEVRGSYSAQLPKKPYGIETRVVNWTDGTFVNNNVSLLGMPRENDWTLNSLAKDFSLLHDLLSYKLARDLGHYASRGVPCEVIVNDTYVGIYILQEKIKSDGNRVDIEELLPGDNTEPAISGGYIIKADKPTGNDNSVTFTMDGDVVSQPVSFFNDTPDKDDITPAQDTYIESVFRSLETMTDNNNESISDGFPSVIDFPTFIDFMLVNEIASNADAYQYSTFFYKDRKNKLMAGPVWDFNFAWGLDVGNRVGSGRSSIHSWQFLNGDNEGPRFWKRLFNNTTFRCYFAKRWQELTAAGMPLNATVINTWIDQNAAQLTEASAREIEKWHEFSDYPFEIAYLKQFVIDRSAWIAANIGNSDGCQNPVLPSLVINEIMFNPPGSSENEEFIEIKNAGGSVVDLTGIYFSGLGLSYQFPAGSTLAAGGLLVIGSNQAGYSTQYGAAPFGEYARKLSNSSQKLVLADAYGNIIDEVSYSDSAPWPDADGNGKSLELTDVTLDNNQGSNWFTRSTQFGSPGLDNGSSLPVHLLRFTAKGKKDYNLLEWKTASETNNDHFELEKSANGFQFVKIGENIRGALNTGIPTSYEYKDYELSQGTQYYRLKQVDTDGSFQHSWIVSVKNEVSEVQTLYPNPGSNEIYVESATLHFDFKIVDIQGKVIDSGSGQSKKAISIAGLHPGLYLLITNNQTIRFVKK